MKDPNCAVKPKLAACHIKLSPLNLRFTQQVSAMHIVHCTSPVNTMFTSSLTQFKKLHKASDTISTRVDLHDTSQLQMLRPNPLRV